MGDLNVEYFVIDNDSDDMTSSLTQEYSFVTLIRNDRKLGFATNNNLVL